MAKKSNLRNNFKKMMNKDMVDYVLWFIIIVLVLAIIYVLCQNNESFSQEDDSSVVPTSDDRANLVLFYAPWCGHCSSTKPEFENAMKDLNNKKINNKTIKLMMIDCDADPSMNQKFNIEGYPTIKLLKKSSQVEYNGDRTSNSFKEFVNDNA